MYRRLTLKKGTLRLRVILGSSGELAIGEVLVRMMAIQFLFWTIPAAPVRIASEADAEQYELTFVLPGLAAWVIRKMRRLYRLTGFWFLVPRILILRDPDWCAKGKTLPLCFWLYEREVEYQEPFAATRVESDSEEQRQEVRWAGHKPPNQTHLRLVVDNGPYVPREPAPVRYDEIPFEYHGIADIRGDGDRTDPIGCRPSDPPTGWVGGRPRHSV